MQEEKFLSMFHRDFVSPNFHAFSIGFRSTGNPVKIDLFQDHFYLRLIEFVN